VIAKPGDDRHARRMLYPKIFTFVRIPQRRFFCRADSALQMLVIIAFIAHREGCPASKQPGALNYLISTCTVDFNYIILNK
jgi:hypothetical protein